MPEDEISTEQLATVLDVLGAYWAEMPAWGTQMLRDLGYVRAMAAAISINGMLIEQLAECHGFSREEMLGIVRGAVMAA